ncbi:hypothetical protein [Aureispira anguillae]|uniref:Uncharacterized protein n=1 Tax=Aureispira anguillae TaxID=2864201 RepID=A0A915YCK5_9BACT|nr:hypothetical protein [Aureispira anguillae]BDS10593.1 hypothetical protein AsAng_0013010 [Aureispira anguillae]
MIEIEELPDVITVSELIAQVIGETVFMISSERPGDKEYEYLQNLDLNKMRQEAELYFLKFTDEPKKQTRLIYTKKHRLEDKLELFLSNYPLLDEYAVIQNIKNNLEALDQLYETVKKQKNR